LTSEKQSPAFGMKHSGLHYLDLKKLKFMLMNTFFDFLKEVKCVLAYKQKISLLPTLQLREEEIAGFDFRVSNDEVYLCMSR